MSLRERTRPVGRIPPCLPLRADRPPSGPEWLHEIKHDGFRIMARRNRVDHWRKSKNQAELFLGME